MGATAALHVELVGNPMHIDCDRNCHTAFVLIVMHIYKCTLVFSKQGLIYAGYLKEI